MIVTYYINIAYSSADGIILTKEDYKALAQILGGGKNGAHFKPIKGQKNLFSAYLSDEARLLLVKYKNTLRIIDKFSSHDAYMEKLKQKGLAQQYLQKLSHLTKDEFNLIFSATPHPDPAYTLSDKERSSLKNKINPDELPVGLYYTVEGKTIELNAKQEIRRSSSHSETSYVCIVEGGPGTGKTSTLTADFEKTYGAINRLATQPETKHSSEDIHQFLYVATPDLAEKHSTHCKRIIPNKTIPCLSLSYQDFAAMVDDTIPPTSTKQKPNEQKKYKVLKTEADFIHWCKQRKIKPEDYLETTAENKSPFYKKLYLEFRVLCACPDLITYQTLGVQESLFPNDTLLQKSLFDLFKLYTKDFVDLSFYDLRPAIQRYKTENPHLVPHLYVDETQILSRIQALNLIEYGQKPENMFFSINTAQSVHDPISNSKFIKLYFESRHITIRTIGLDESYRSPEPMVAMLKQVSILENQYIGGIDSKTHNETVHLKPGEIHLISDSKPNKALLLKECQKLCVESNCAVIVGHESLLPTVKKYLKTKLIYTTDISIGLEFDHIIFVDPLAGFSEEELQSLLSCSENIDPNILFLNHPKNKYDKSKLLVLPKLKKLNVGISRATKSLRILIDNEPEKTRTRTQQTISSLKTKLINYLLAESEITSTPTIQHTTQQTPQQIHQGWVDICQQMIIHEKDYQRAKEICQDKGIKPTELRLPEELEAQIPREFHGTFFRTLDQQYPKAAPSTFKVAQELLIHFSERYVADFFSANLTNPNKIKAILFKTILSDNKTLWYSLNYAQKTLLFSIVHKLNRVDTFQKMIADDPNILFHFALYFQQQKEYTLGHKIQMFDKSQAIAHYQWGVIYKFGLNDVTPDLEKAIQCFKFGIEQNFYPAYLELAHSFEHGIGVEQDLAEAFKHYEYASNHGDALASCALGRWHDEGRYGKQLDLTQACQFFQLSIEQGSHDAQPYYRVARFYELGKYGLEQDHIKAVELYRKASDLGHINAQYELGRCYECGLGGLEQSDTEAVKWFTLASDRGHSYASCSLGIFYKLGEGGLEQNHSKAFNLFQLSLSQGSTDVRVFYELAQYYDQGLEGLTPQNYTEAARLLKLASDRKYPLAQSALGEYYTLGLGGLKRDHVTAFNLYKAASDHGIGAAQCNLGIYLEFGLCKHSFNEEQKKHIIAECYQSASNNGNLSGRLNFKQFCQEQDIDMDLIKSRANTRKRT